MYETPDENGRVFDDAHIEYMKAHVEQLAEAIKDGVDVSATLWWGPIDVVSSGTSRDGKALWPDLRRPR